jgi:hypothetical protein
MTPALIAIVMITTPDAVGADGETRSGAYCSSQRSKNGSRRRPWGRSFAPATARVADRLPFSRATILVMMHKRASPPALKSP